MEDCIFCKILNKEIPTEFVYENEDLVAFNDIHPRANTHILIVPRKHIETIKDLKEDERDELLVGKMVLAARDIAKKKNLDGYNLVFNVGRSAGQIVFHIHLHLMSNG
ncbi:histidine triad nucleotide-binding protein [Candidatus Peregrinibacteria bacterium]|nr:histidine triad nucleotide-binding protein [Candidatus Peregrinibacteria bacterium]